jgi:transposase
MSAGDKAIILAEVENQSRGKRQVLMALGIPKSSYYRWRRGQPDSGNRRRPWNWITPEEEDKVLAVAQEYTEFSSRQLSAWITDNEGFAVSESTVYRILRREGLVKCQETQLRAGKEYHAKTTRPHQMWATDACYFRVVGWGYYYLVTVMDDHSRFIPAWKLQKDMTANSLIEVVQEAVCLSKPGCSRITALATSPGLSGITCVCWVSGISWLRPIIPRLTARWNVTSSL